jgi:predicted DsbA family dithiol-disulfide isomerase
MSAPAPTQAPVSIDVVSDVVCPWCYLGKQRLEAALASLPHPVAVRWRPYQLDPTLPPEGKERRAYMLAKFGSSDRIEQAHARLAAMGAEEGIAFAFDRIAISPNTLDAHRLIRWAGAGSDPALQGAVVDALFRAYFVEGRNIGDRAVLADIAGACGLDAAEIAARLATDEDRAAVEAEVAEAQAIGVTGVPTFILAGRYALVGAQPAEEIARALAQIAAQAPASPAA